ncbi:MAG: ATP-dependent Zn protease, partial [candidate division WS6 bacterium GW2011_WS6_36_26]
MTAVKYIYSRNPNISFRYYIEGYPDNTEKILSPEGFGKDSLIPVQNKLVIVTGSASNSGKLSTCSVLGLNSDYAKYETFPIWNLPLEHPVNLAYEAATADIGDRNVIDTYYQQAYGKTAVNYNRDIQAFSVVKKLMESEYQSPTDMGISNAGFAITDDEVV